VRGRARLRVITDGWRMPATSAEARILARACLFAGLMAFVTAAVPFSPTAPTRLTAVLGVVGLLLSAGLWWASERVPRVAMHVVVATATALVSLCIAASTTPTGRPPSISA
jgi:hypothetical protein